MKLVKIDKPAKDACWVGLGRGSCYHYTCAGNKPEGRYYRVVSIDRKRLSEVLEGMYMYGVKPLSLGNASNIDTD